MVALARLGVKFPANFISLGTLAIARFNIQYDFLRSFSAATQLTLNLLADDGYGRNHRDVESHGDAIHDVTRLFSILGNYEGL